MKKNRPREARIKRHRHIRVRLAGTPARPRLAVFRSLNHIYAQVIDDAAGVTLVAASDLDESLKAGDGNKAASAARVGALVAKKAQEKGISAVVFDRGGFKYHGRVKALADAAREAGLVF